jgi:hypothetical protein
MFSTEVHPATNAVATALASMEIGTVSGCSFIMLCGFPLAFH